MKELMLINPRRKRKKSFRKNPIEPLSLMNPRGSRTYDTGKSGLMTVGGMVLGTALGILLPRDVLKTKGILKYLVQFGGGVISPQSKVIAGKSLANGISAGFFTALGLSLVDDLILKPKGKSVLSADTDVIPEISADTDVIPEISAIEPMGIDADDETVILPEREVSQDDELSEISYSAIEPEASQDDDLSDDGI